MLDGTLHLDSLATGDIPALNATRAAEFKEKCLWCLGQHNHRSGVVLKLKDQDTRAFYGIEWSDIPDHDSISRYYNLDDALPDGATAIALLVIRERTPVTGLERGYRSSCIDYWLCKQSANPDYFMGKPAAQLEISGILTESPTNTVLTRVGCKRKQTAGALRSLPIYIIVIEFSRPWATLELRDVKHS